MDRGLPEQGRLNTQVPKHPNTQEARVILWVLGCLGICLSPHIRCFANCHAMWIP